MNISQAAKLVGLPAKTIRYYEEIGLVISHRASNGYRVYDDRDLHMLTFLARARSLGFTIDQCRSLLALYKDPNRASSNVKKFAERHVEEIEHKIVELNGMRDTLSTLIEACHGDDLPNCPIITELARPLCER